MHDNFPHLVAQLKTRRPRSFFQFEEWATVGSPMRLPSLVELYQPSSDSRRATGSSALEPKRSNATLRTPSRQNSVAARESALKPRGCDFDACAGPKSSSR
jgi:hypothetical protein